MHKFSLRLGRWISGALKRCKLGTHTSMRNLGYEAKLKRWDINRLEDRRARGDLIPMYKSVNGLDEIKWENDRVNLSTERAF